MRKEFLVLLHWVVLLGIFSFLGIKAAQNFSADWDFLAYHLPFALMHYDMTTFIPGTFLMEAYKGFPPLTHIIQGALIKATGIMSVGSLINVLILVVMLFCLKVLLRYEVRWFLTFCLAIPIFVIQYSSHYIDFWVACSVAIVFASCVRIFEIGFKLPASGSLLLGIFGGMYSKFQAWPFIAICLGVVILVRLWLEKGAFFRAKNLLWISLNVLIAVAFPIRNIIEFGNPTYPVPAPLVGRFFSASPPSFTKDELDPIIPLYLRDASNPRKFVESSFELNRLRAGGFRYSIDQGYNEGPSLPHFRMGGWFFATVIGMTMVLLAMFLKSKSIRAPIALYGSLVLMLMFIPQNHELRYWIFVPICGLFLVAQNLNIFKDSQQFILKAFFVLCAVYVFTETTDRYRLPRISHVEATPGAAREFWAKQQRAGQTIVCLPVIPPWGIFWAGPMFNEVPVKYCAN